MMRNNILRQDLDALIEHPKQDDSKLTHGANVRIFEEEWSKLLGRFDAKRSTLNQTKRLREKKLVSSR